MARRNGAGAMPAKSPSRAIGDAASAVIADIMSHGTSGAISQKVGTIVEADGTPVLGADAGGVVLRWKHALSFTYTMGSWSGTVTQNFSKGYRAGNDLNDDPVFIGDQSLFDLNLTYRGIKNLTLGVGAKNIFNTQPDTFVPVSNQFQAGYDVTQYDPRGRVIYVNASYKF